MLTSGTSPRQHDGEREGEVADSTNTTTLVRLDARTPRGFSAGVALAAAFGCFFGLGFARVFGRPGWAPALGPLFAIGLALLNVAATTEWTVAGHDLCRRGWLSKPGSEPHVVMTLGPQVEFVHEHSRDWQLRPRGPSIVLWPWQAASFVSAIESTGVRISDWRGDWARRHPLLDKLGLLAQLGLVAGGMAEMLLIAIGWQMPQLLSWLFYSSFLLVIALDFLPWNLLQPTIR
jgi:hypothetical protein